MWWRLACGLAVFLQGVAFGIWLGWSAGKDDVNLSRELYHNCIEEKTIFFRDLYQCREKLQRATPGPERSLLASHLEEL